MTYSLDIHPATDAERVAAHANCHDVWSLGLDLESHILRREHSALHRRGRWIVGCMNRRVVVALASHPLRFRLHGQSLAGIGIASVHTLPEFRGQGFAQQLVSWIENFEQRQGARLSLLFCDIEPRYYERLGYQLCPAHVGWAEASIAAIPADDQGWQLQPFATGQEFADQVPAQAQLYDSDHGRRPLAIERPHDYWLHLAARHPLTTRYWLLSTAGARSGYIWLRASGKDVIVDDHAVRDGDAALRETLLRLVIRHAGQEGFARVGGWLPTESPAANLFALATRRDEISMIKPLDNDVVIDGAAVQAADWFQEIDHV